MLPNRCRGWWQPVKKALIFKGFRPFGTHSHSMVAGGLLVALGGQIQHPAQGVVVREGRLVLRNLPELAVQALDDVRRVYDFPNLHGVFEERA